MKLMEKIDMINYVVPEFEKVDASQEMIFYYWLAYEKDALYTENIKKLQKQFDCEDEIFDVESIMDELRKFYLDYLKENPECVQLENKVLDAESFLREYWDDKKETYFYRRNILDLLSRLESVNLYLDEIDVLQYLRKMEIKETRLSYHTKWNEISNETQGTVQYEVVLERYCMFFGTKYQEKSNLLLLKEILIQYGFTIQDNNLSVDLDKIYQNIENPAYQKMKIKKSRQIRKRVVMKKETISVSGYFRRRNGHLEYVRSYIRKK